MIPVDYICHLWWEPTIKDDSSKCWYQAEIELVLIICDRYVLIIFNNCFLFIKKQLTWLLQTTSELNQNSLTICLPLTDHIQSFIEPVFDVSTCSFMDPWLILNTWNPLWFLSLRLNTLKSHHYIIHKTPSNPNQSSL